MVALCVSLLSLSTRVCNSPFGLLSRLSLLSLSLSFLSLLDISTGASLSGAASLRRGSGLSQRRGSVLRRAVQDVRLAGCARVACGPPIRWLAMLFDLDEDAASTKVSWSCLLQFLAVRLAADVELGFWAKFPWPLSHLSVPAVSRRRDGSISCRLVVEHFCCEAYKIACGDNRLVLRAPIYGISFVCRFSGKLHFEYDRIPYADLLAFVYLCFE